MPTISGAGLVSQSAAGFVRQAKIYGVAIAGFAGECDRFRAAISNKVRE